LAFSEKIACRNALGGAQAMFCTAVSMYLIRDSLIETEYWHQQGWCAFSQCAATVT
jgi:hypothetical protein